MKALPDDPVNVEGTGVSYLGDGSPTDLGYVYNAYNETHHDCTNNQCQNFVLGTNLESPTTNPGYFTSNSVHGNYQLGPEGPLSTQIMGNW